MHPGGTSPLDANTPPGRALAFPCPWKTVCPLSLLVFQDKKRAQERASSPFWARPSLPCMTSGFSLPSPVLSYALKEHVIFYTEFMGIILEIFRTLVCHNTE